MNIRFIFLLALVGVPNPGIAQDVTYLRHIKPILRERCYACHGALKQESSLRLDTVSAILAGGDGGAVILKNKSSVSPLIERISATSDDERMPPEGHPLSKAQIDAIRRWIDSGADAPDDEQPDDDPLQHWAFQPPVAALVPQTDERFSNPIDAFLQANRTRQSLRTVRPVEKKLLLRRLYLDLVGFPPTANQLQQFQADPRADAYERVVENLLARPQHGERWGRHWMDVWRYTDWYGLGAQLRNSQKHIWRWRDWIVDSLNRDQGYDRMILEMLAGDELAPSDRHAVAGTGFLARNYYLFNRTTWLDSTIEHTSKAFLGLTMNCAKCHDHKYDPIKHEDYYRMRAIFEPHQVRLDPIPGQIDLEKDGLPRAFDAHPDAATYVHLRGDAKNVDTSQAILPGTPQFFQFGSISPVSISLPLESHWPSALPFVLKDRLDEANRKIDNAKRSLVDLETQKTNSGRSQEPKTDDLHERIAEWKLKVALLEPQKMITAYEADLAKQTQLEEADRLAKTAAKSARIFERAVAELEVLKLEESLQDKADAKQMAQLKNAREKLEAAQKAIENPGNQYDSIRSSLKALEGPAETSDSRMQPYPKTSTGRRLALAEWIVHAKNPLAARVAVNQIWMRHFGQPLVESVTDFGRRANRPLQQELLDWLAVQLIQSGWSMKSLHRMIVTSDAYKLGSHLDDRLKPQLEADANNNYYWRRQPIRMESQVVRDSLLHLADVMDWKLGGPSLNPNAQSTRRRSLYFLHSRDHQHKLLSMFDDADIFRCYRRTESVVPQQALALANSQLSLKMSDKIAARILSDFQAANGDNPVDDVDFGKQCFLEVLCRHPSDQEIEFCVAALKKWETIVMSGNPDSKHGSSRKYRNLVHSLINHNDFVTIR